MLKEVSASKLDAQDKRISDIGLATAQQGNHLSAISNQTAAVSNYIAWTSGVITLFVFIAGFATYFSAKIRAEKEARDASANWFKEHSNELRMEIEKIRELAKHTKDGFSQAGNEVAASAVEVRESMKKHRNSVLSYSLADGDNAHSIDSAAEQAVNRVSDELKEKPEASFTAEEHFARGLSYVTRQNHLSALESFRAASKALPATAPADATARYLLAQGVTLGELNKSEEAIAVYDEIDSRFGKDESPGVREQVAKGLINKGVAIRKLGKPEQAVAVYDEIVSRFGKDKSPSVLEPVAKGLFNKGFTLDRLGKSERAIAAYDEIDSRFGKVESSVMREHVAKGLLNKGATLDKLSRSQEAIAAYDELDSRFGKDEAPGVREPVTGGLLNKGVTLDKLGKLEDAIAVYGELDIRFGKDESPGVREQVAKGLINKGVTLRKLGKSEQEIAVYDEIDGRFGKDESPGVREQVANARNRLAFDQIITAKQHWQDAPRKKALLAAAIKLLESALLICAKDVRVFVSGNLGYALFLRGDHAAAADPTRECLKLGGDTALAAQREDAKLHRVEPDDSDYEALLTRLWAELHPATGPSGARSQENS